MVLVWALMVCTTARSQDVAVKTNLFYDAFATINVGAEVGLAPKWTLDVSGNVNAWTLSHGRKWKHWMVQPEARYWLRVISSPCMPMEGSTTSAALKTISRCLAPTFRGCRRVVIRAGS